MEKIKRRRRYLSLGLCLLGSLFILSSLARAEEKGLVLHYTFDEGSGTVASDKSGNNNNGKIYGPNYVKQEEGYALKFDGFYDYVDCGNAPSLNITDAITVEAWMKRAGSGSARVVTKGNYWTIGHPWAIVCQLDSMLRFAIEQNTAMVREYKKNSIMGEWLHIAGTFDKDLPSHQMKLYVNGVCEAHATRTTAIPITAHSVYVGGQQNVIDYKGLIDEVAIYNRALSAEEIKEHYQAGAREKR